MDVGESLGQRGNLSTGQPDPTGAKFPPIPSKWNEPDVARSMARASSSAEPPPEGRQSSNRSQAGRCPEHLQRPTQLPRPSYDQLRQTSQPTPSDLEVLLRTTEVARRLQVSARTILAWAQASKLPSILTPGGHRRYPVQGVEQVLATMTAAGEQRVDEHR